MRQVKDVSLTKKMVRVYKFIALIAFNTIFLFFLINVILFGLLQVRSKIPPGLFPSSTKQKILTYREKFSDINSYSVISSTDAEQYLDEQDAMGSRGFQYAPWVQFRNPTVQGNFLNTNRDGFRKTRKPRRVAETSIVISVFGGSTTFGYGVPDEYTIPSYMQAILETKYLRQASIVQNYGQGFYYSSQEMLLLLTLIKDGNIPDVAVFIDGANDTHQLSFQCDQPYFTDSMKTLWNRERQNASPWNQDYSWIPMVRIGKALLPFLSKTAPKPRKASAPKANYIVDRYIQNMNMIRAICHAYQIQCYFIWQPVPFYKYDRSLHKTFPYEGGIPSIWGNVYRMMKEYSSPDFLYLGEMLEHLTEKVFVDDVHYNEKYNEQIAMKICDFLQLDNSDSLHSEQ